MFYLISMALRKKTFATPAKWESAEPSAMCAGVQIIWFSWAWLWWPNRNIIMLDLCSRCFVYTYVNKVSNLTRNFLPCLCFCETRHDVDCQLKWLFHNNSSDIENALLYHRFPLLLQRRDLTINCTLHIHELDCAFVEYLLNKMPSLVPLAENHSPPTRTAVLSMESTAREIMWLLIFISKEAKSLWIPTNYFIWYERTYAQPQMVLKLNWYSA